MKGSLIKNSFFLYIRIIFTVGITFVTTRILLENLGIENFGIYNIIFSVSNFFLFLNSSLTQSTHRFINASHVKGVNYVNKIFSISLSIHILISIIIFFISLLLGWILLNNFLNIGNYNVINAYYVLIFSLISLSFYIIQVPFNALLLSYEYMKEFAIISIIDVIFKLIIALILVYYNDKILIYSFLLSIVSFVIFVIYIYVCFNKIKFLKYTIIYDKLIYREILTFSFWTFLSSFANSIYLYGTNFLLNIFFTPLMNTSRGISLQVFSGLNQLITTFQLVFVPRIMKSYKINSTFKPDFNQMNNLIYISSKYSVYIVSIFVLPFLINTEYILSIWLNEYPEYTVIFVRLIIINLLIDSFSNPILTGIQAKGNIKFYNIITTIIIILNMPISFILLKMGNPAYIVYLVSIGLSLLSLISKIFIAQKEIYLDVKKYTLLFVKHISFYGFLFFILNIIKYKNNDFSLTEFILINTLFVFIISLAMFLFIGKNDRRSVIIKIYKLWK